MSLDHTLLFSLNMLVGQSPELDRSIVFFAHYFPYVLAVLFVIFVLTRSLRSREKARLFVAGFGAAFISRVAIVELIRAFIHRPRPLVNEAIHALLQENSFSFPSGHAAFFFALSTVIFLSHRKWGVWFFAGSLLIGLARVAAGVHYPSDIAAGALVGVLVGYLVVRIDRRFFPREVMRA